MTRWMNIGEAAAAAGVSPKMIRHYEQIGLVPEASRSEAGYRRYGEREVSILRFIRQSRRLGFSMEQIAELLGLWSNRGRSSRAVKAVAQRHLADLETKMREMAEMQLALGQLVSSCHGGDDPHCAILDGLALQSPAPPEPGSVGARLLRKGAGAQEPRAPAHAPGPSTSHVDLMAWTRQVRAGHGSH